ncbi:MAG TPA: hypothetical protein VEC57_00050 [Candidatus Limnocylindrales bacterium]|nr:hypothetical protein [Candidatus Limnocylindrales bacterium]
MANVTPGYTFTSASDPITFTKLNLIAQPTVTIGTAEVTNTMLASSNGIGYVSGTGGAVTQATSKSTGVTINKPCGTITMNNAALNAGTSVGFTVTNSVVAATDVVTVNIKSGATADSYTVTVDAVAAGSFRISLRNYTGGNLSEAVVLSFGLIKAVAA